jgi:hypothetical protein
LIAATGWNGSLRDICPTSPNPAGFPGVPVAADGPGSAPDAGAGGEGAVFTVGALIATGCGAFESARTPVTMMFRTTNPRATAIATETAISLGRSCEATGFMFFITLDSFTAQAPRAR